MLQFSYSIDNDNVTSNQTTTNPHQSWTKLTFVTFYMILPMAGLALLWGRKDLLTKFLLQIDRNCVAVFCPSLSRRQKLLSWANRQLPITWQITQQQQQSNGINDLWKNGSLLCNIINTIVPGACQNPYRHWKKPPIHAQALAYKYFQIPPLFAEKELSDDLTINQEHNFIHYLYELQQAINKWATTKDFDVVNHYKFSSQCVARGMGLYTGEQYRKTVFYIYTKNQPKHCDIFIFLRGPYGTKGKAIIPTTTNNLTIPTIDELRQRFNKNHNDINKRSSFLPNIPLMRSFIKNNNNDDINKDDSNDIEIKIQHESDRIKIIYIPTNYGIYEINLIANGELFKSSPFHVNIIKNSSGIRDSFNQITINKSNRIRITKRRIISKTIDCIDETLIINDNNVQKMHNSQLTEIQENDNDDGVRLDTPDSSICTQDSGIDEQIKINDNFPNNRTIDATPICLDHIDCDVDSINYELINKRKHLSKQNSVNFSNSSFSTTIIDNDVGLDHLHKQNNSDDFEELSVMNVLATIKQSTKRSLNSTISLPDMTDLCHYEDVFKTKRDYWEKLSMQTSSTTSLIRVDTHERKINHNYDNRCNSYDNNNNREEYVNKSSFGSLKFDRCSNNFLTNSKKFKSSDDTLDNCTIPTIEERKRNLLKDRYDKEVVRTTKNIKELESVQPQHETILPVAERIEKLASKGFCRNNTITNVINKSPLKIDEVEQTKSNEKFKSPFKRAINYFRNLERTTKLIKIKYNNKKSPKRRYSADTTECNNNKNNINNNNYSNNNNSNSNNNKGRSNSLNLPIVSQRFSINNLYKDVTGGGCSIRRNSFKGAPNKNAVIDSLASLNYNEHLPKRNNQDLPEDECSIEYNLFINRGKTKKRRSLCNLFEVHY